MLAERTVTLLAFEDANQSPLADLMDVTQRQKTASELNAAILSSQSQVSNCMLARGLTLSTKWLVVTIGLACLSTPLNCLLQP